MSQDLVVLFAAGMLVTAYLMVGQRALFTAIRLYALQSMLLGGVAIVMGLADHRSHLLVERGAHDRPQGRLDPVVPDARHRPHRDHTARSSRS